ncbi:hypothetical protein [Nostoc sphaeroides]|nr:hypothetical protein [Nostoc sphaeroides]
MWIVLCQLSLVIHQRPCTDAINRHCTDAINRHCTDAINRVSDQ